jgi:Bacterial Ig domain
MVVRSSGVSAFGWACRAGMRAPWQLLFATVLFALQGVLGSTAAFALSAGCTQVNGLSTASASASIAPSSFDSGDTLTVSFENNGLDTSGPSGEPSSDAVAVDSQNFSTSYLTYYASTNPVGSESVTVPAGNLSSSGLFMHIIATNGNITGVTYACTNGAAAAPVAGSVTATVAANSSANAISLNVTGGTATSVAVATGPSHGTATATGTSITYAPTSGYSGTDSFTYTATNSTGTSSAATVSITVTPPTLAFSPAAGALPPGTVGTARKFSS